MPGVEVACPGCGAKLKAPDNMAGKKAKCNKCSKKFRIPESKPVDSGAGTAPPTPPKRPAYDQTEAMPAAPADASTGPMPAIPTSPPARGKDVASLPSADPFDFRKPTKPGGSAKPSAPAAPPLQAPPAKPAPEPLSLDDKPDPLPLPLSSPEPASRSKRRGADENAPRPRKAGATQPAGDTANPFAFGAAGAEVQPRESRRRNDEADNGPRYRSGKGGTNTVLIVTGLVGALALALGIAAVVLWVQSRHPEPPKQEKKETAPEAESPAPKNPEPKEPEPKPKEPEPEPKGPMSPVSGLTRPAVAFTKLTPFTVGALPAKPEPADKPRVRRTLELPPKSVKRVFPPADLDSGDTYVLHQIKEPEGGLGGKLALDSYGPAGNLRAEDRIEYESDGLAEPIADVHASKDGAFFLASVGGKLHVWSLGNKEKLIDGVGPYGDKPGHAKSGVAAAFFAANPKQLVLISTAGAVLLYDVETRKPLDEFVPPHGATGKVSLGRSVAKAAGGGSVVVAVGGILYQVRSAPGLDRLRTHDLGGDVARSFALAASGTPGHFLYVFQSAPNKAGKQDTVAMVLPPGDSAKPATYRFPSDSAGSPKGALWAGDDFGGVVTDRGVLWFGESDKVLEPLVMTQSEAGGEYFGDAQLFWYVIPKPKDEKKSLLVALPTPFDSFAEWQKEFPANRPLRAVKLDASGLLK